jgi:hypothetical protein
MVGAAIRRSKAALPVQQGRKWHAAAAAGMNELSNINRTATTMRIRAKRIRENPMAAAARRQASSITRRASTKIMNCSRTKNVEVDEWMYD